MPIVIMLSILLLLLIETLGAQNLTLEVNPVKHEGIDHRLVYNRRAPKITQSGQLSKLNQNGEAIVILEPLPGLSAKSIDHDAIGRVGGRILAESSRLVRVAIHPYQIESLLEVKGVNFIRPPYAAHYNYTSEGVRLINVLPNRSRGVSGQGVKVAIIDGGFAGVNRLPVEIPADRKEINYTNKSFYSGSNEHGTGIAEIIFDIAPNAELHLIKIDDLIDFERAKDYCIREDIDIVNYSGAWLVAGFGDGFGEACDIVNSAADRGILWVNSAGNYANSMYTGLWADRDADGWHNFDGEVETLSLQNVQAGDLIELILTWNDWPSSSQNFDLYLWRVEGGEPEEVASSTNYQLRNSPVENLEYSVTKAGRYVVAVKKASNARTKVLKVWSLNHDFERNSSLVGSIGVPADSRGAFSVGAISYRDWRFNTIASYSSQGPTVDGRIKPDISAPAGVSTASYGANAFDGTSAAAPHVAGVAALIKSANPAYTRSQIIEALVGEAVDVGDRGKDNVFGHGKLATPYLQSVDTPEITSLSLISVKYRDTLKIRGRNFGSERGGSEVIFFSDVAPAPHLYRAWTDTEISVMVPTGARTGNLVVSTDRGTSNAKRLIITSPWVRSVTSTEVKAGDSITIRGANFGTSKGSSSVSMGSNQFTNFQRWSNSQIQAIVPENSRSGNLTVRTDNGSSNSVRIEVVSPFLSWVLPRKGKIGDEITLAGGNFGANRSSGYVRFGAVRVYGRDYVSWNNTRIVVKVPERAVAVSDGSITVTTVNGTSGGRTFEVEREQYLSLPSTANHGYNPPTVEDYPKRIVFQFDDDRTTGYRNLILTWDMRKIQNNEVTLTINDSGPISLPAEENWDSWFYLITAYELSRGLNEIEFKNVWNTNRSSNFATWELRNVRLWTSFPAKLVAVNGFKVLGNSSGLGIPYPTPFNSEVHIPLQINDPVYVEVSLYNLLGQKIQTLLSGHTDSGHYTLSWDGRDFSGRVLANGLYLVVADIGGVRETVRVTFIK